MRHIYRSFIPVCVGLLLWLPSGSVFAQKSQPQAGTQSDGAAEPPDPQLKISPLKILEQFEPPVDAAYELGNGDTIDLFVAGHPDLTHSYVIGPDGKITIPGGSVQVANLTREAAAKTVADLLGTLYMNPSVTIGVQKYGSNSIMIFGNVKNPGVLNYEGTTPTLLDAIARAGMVANPTSKDGLPDRCMIYRGNDQSITVELKQLLMGGSPLSDLRLRRGDMIFIPIQQQQFVSVLGDVLHPGPVAITPDLDLRMAITQAGGLGPEAGGNPTIHIAQASTNREITISFKQLMKPGGGMEVRLHPGDSIFVPKSGFNKVTYVLTRLSPIATMFTLGALMAP